MSQIGFSLQGGGYGQPRHQWGVVVAVVTLVTVGIVMLVRAFSADEKDKSASASVQNAAAVETSGDKKNLEPAAPFIKKEHLVETDSVLALIAAGQSAEQNDDLFAARTNYLAALASPDCRASRELIENRLGAVDIGLIFSPRVMPEKIDHAIIPGESLKILAKRHGTTVDLIVKGNTIPNPDRIQVGDRIRILDGAKFELTVGKKSNELLVTMNGLFFKRYKVGTGKYSKTPVGSFCICDKIPEPPWWHPDGKVVPFGDKENILGTRWMAIEATGDTPPAKGYGIHGTWDDSSLGQQSSAGCIRMNNGDVEELFTYIPIGTAVRITED